jgi:tetratricopeptide (TPR) repeat protein
MERQRSILMCLLFLLPAVLLFPQHGSAETAATAPSANACLQAGELVKLNELGRAIELYTLCLNTAGLTDEVRAGVLIDRGNAYNAAEQGDLALADFTRAVGLDPKNSIAYNNRGNALKRKGRYDEAIADFTRAVELAPLNTMIYNNRANAYKHKGLYDRAVADLDKAIELNSANAVSYYNRACLEAERKNTAAACDWLGKAMDRGFDEKALIQADRDLDNIRGAACYRKLMERK